MIKRKSAFERLSQVFWGLVFDICFITFQVGALEACVLAKQGYEVHLYEYRKGTYTTHWGKNQFFVHLNQTSPTNVERKYCDVQKCSEYVKIWVKKAGNQEFFEKISIRFLLLWIRILSFFHKELS